MVETEGYEVSASKWNAAYLSNTHLSSWPWSDLVSFVNRYTKDLPLGTNLLEFGFGAGANLPFLLSLSKFNYYGIDQSEAALKYVCAKFPAVSNRLRSGHLTEKSFPNVLFGLVVDRASLTHNSTENILKILKILRTCMSPSGVFIGIDWFSKSHDDSNLGLFVDSFPRTDISSGQFAELGDVHFSDVAHLTELFNDAGFKIERLEHKLISRKFPAEGNFGSFNFVARAINHS